MHDISFRDAVRLSQAHVPIMSHEVIRISQAVGRVAAKEIHSLVDSPSADVSVKDGYALISDDVAKASTNHPVSLQVISSAAAGDCIQHEVSSGQTIRVLSGAVLPKGANAVLAEEFTRLHGELIEARADAHEWRNVLGRGGDVQAGELLAKPHQELTLSLRYDVVSSAAISILPVSGAKSQAAVTLLFGRVPCSSYSRIFFRNV